MKTMEQNQLLENRYRLLKEQGRGSFGEVWLARDEQLDMQVAIKIYIALDDRGIDEFKKEFKTAYRLNHPNLLHAYHFDICDRRPFLVMPYCPDSALSLIGKCDRDTLWRFIREVSSGLAYLHSLDIVHQDIKPDNILRTEEGGFVITDFGISTKMRSTLRRNSTRKMDSDSSGGSLPYMGPEMFAAKAESVKATDIWAFGVTLYEMITGSLPFFGHGGAMQLNGAAVPELEYEDPEIVKIVMACMSKDTWDRPTAESIALAARKFTFDSGSAETIVSNPEAKKDAGATVPMQGGISGKDTHEITGQDEEQAPKPVKKNKGAIFLLFLLAGAIICTFSALILSYGSREAKEAYPRYSELAIATRSAIESGVTSDNIATIRSNIGSLKSMESLHAKKDRRFSESASIEESFSSGIGRAFDAFVSAAEAASQNDIKADCYYNALQIKNDASVREKYYALVDKMNGIKRVDFVMVYRDDSKELYADAIDYRLKDGKFVRNPDAAPLVASKVTYLDLYFEFECFEDVEKKYNKQTFYVKILQPDGTLLTGKESPKGYTYKDSIDLGEGRAEIKGYSTDGQKVWCLGWGNEQKTVYKAGTYKVEVYNNGRRLFSIPVIFR